MLKKSSTAMLANGLLKKAPQVNKQQWTSEMIENIISLSTNDGEQYINKNSFEEILVKIDKQHIQIIDKFANYRQKGFNLLEFVRFFLNIIAHDEIENLYLAIGLIDLFKAISTFAGEERVNFSHITNFLCQRILEKQQSKNQIESKNVPQITFVNPKYQIKDFIMNPPTIFGSNQQTLYKLSPNSILTDKAKHNRAVSWSAFSNDLRMVFSMDALSQFIAVYDFNCTQIYKIYPSFSKIKKDVVILGFAFSQRQSRIGAVLKNFSMIFWDRSQSNNFDYEKFWPTTSHCQHLQSSIYYLEYFNCWITSDKTGMIYFWDLLNGCPNRKFKCKYFSSINVLCEISALNIIAIVQESKQVSSQCVGMFHMFNSAVSNNEKKNSFYECNITLYNFFTGEILNEISSTDDRVPHTIQYSQQYQILFGAGLQKKIKMWQINPVYMDSSLKGELIGHENLITSFTLIKKSCLLASCDDKGKIKLWDFRNFACIQTIDFSDKSLITNLLDMVEIGKLGVLGSRIHFIDYEQKHQVIKKTKNKEKLTIDWVDFDECRNEIYVFTQKDLRVIDLAKGSVKYIYGCFNLGDADYTCFRYFACILKFAIGNDRGEVTLYDISTGAFSFQLKAQHQGSIIAIQYDQLNKLFITIGTDSAIIIHKESTKQPIRQIRGNFHGKQISCFQLSVFHNLIAIGTHNNQHSRSIFLWNYEHGKLTGEIVVGKGCDVVAMQFINGYGVLAIGMSEGRVSLVRVKSLIGAEIRLEEIAFLKLQTGITSLTCDIVLKGGKKSQLQQCVLIISFQNGDFQQVNLTNYLTKFDLIPHSKQKTNYNPYRQSKQTFLGEYMKKKHFILKLQQQQSNNKPTGLQKNQSVNVSIHITNKEKSNKLIENNNNDSQLLARGCSKRWIGYDEQQFQADSQYVGGDRDEQQSEEVVSLDRIGEHKRQEDISHQNANEKQGVIQITVDSKPIPSGSSQLNTLKLMTYQKRFLLIVGNNRRLKIFTQEHKLICDLNINYPLPYLWSFKPKVNKKIQDKVYFSMKVLNSILHKYDRDISVGEAKNYKLKALFDSINPKHIVSSESQISDSSHNTVMLTQPVINFPTHKYKHQDKQQKILLIQDEYTKKDLNFNLVKEYNFHEIAGPTLKQFDHIKKIQLLQKQWKQKEKWEEENRDNLLRMIQTKVRKNQEKQEIATFLSPSHKIKDNKQPQYILNFRKKIDNVKSFTKDFQDKDKDRTMPYILSQNKTMAFTYTSSRNESKNGISVKSLKSSLNKLSISEKSLSKFNTTSFEDYYSSGRDKHNNSKLLMKINKTLQGPDYTKFEDKSKNWEEILGVSFRSDKMSTEMTASNKSEKKTLSSGSKFRKILTEMNQKVREKKISKIKLQQNK